MNLPIGHHLRIYRREHLWFPLAVWALFALVVGFMHRDGGRAYDTANAFLSTVLPLAAGVLSASAIVDDNALELQLAAPRAPWRILVERLALLLAIIAVAAAAFQGYLAFLGVDISGLGSVTARQSVWLVPSLALMGLSSLAALALVQGTAGALFTGVIWIMQVMARGWFIASPWGRYLFLFLGGFCPGSPDLLANQACLVALAIAFVVAASLLLRQEERYL